MTRLVMHCVCCNQPFWGEHGCSPRFYLYGGKYFDAIKFGDEHDTLVSDKSFNRCPGCGTFKGSYHHMGCLYEKCPVCGSAIFPGDSKCANCGAEIKFKKEEDEDNGSEV